MQFTALVQVGEHEFPADFYIERFSCEDDDPSGASIRLRFVPYDLSDVETVAAPVSTSAMHNASVDSQARVESEGDQATDVAASVEAEGSQPPQSYDDIPRVRGTSTPSVAGGVTFTLDDIGMQGIIPAAVDGSRPEMLFIEPTRFGRFVPFSVDGDGGGALAAPALHSDTHKLMFAEEIRIAPVEPLAACGVVEPIQLSGRQQWASEVLRDAFALLSGAIVEYGDEAAGGVGPEGLMGQWMQDAEEHEAAHDGADQARWGRWARRQGGQKRHQENEPEE